MATAAPADRQIENHRQPVETAGKEKLHRDAGQRPRSRPRPSSSRAVAASCELGEERRVGAGDQQDRSPHDRSGAGAISPARRPEIVGAGDRQDRQQRDDVEYRRDIFATAQYGTRKKPAGPIRPPSPARCRPRARCRRRSARRAKVQSGPQNGGSKRVKAVRHRCPCTAFFASSCDDLNNGAGVHAATARLISAAAAFSASSAARGGSPRCRQRSNRCPACPGRPSCR